MIQIQVRGVKSVKRTLAQLPRELNKELNKTNGQFMKAVQKSAKLRAPRMTGELAQSIHIRKRGNSSWVLVVDSPYGRYQEEGFAPHWVHALLPTKNRLRTIGQAFNIAGFAYVSKHTPFIRPALEYNLSKLSQKLSDSTKKAIKQAKR